MCNQLAGYIVILGFGLLFLLISSVAAKKFSTEGVDDFVAAGRRIPFGLVAASVMVSWVWTTTLVGSAEAGWMFGISGGLNYSWGAFVPFFIFIPLVLYLRKKMPRCTTFVEFINVRFGPTLARVFMGFAIALIFYILLAQGIGIGVTFNQVFGIPYKVGASLPIIIIGLYIAKAGLRGSIFNDLIQFVIISVILLVTVPIVLDAVGIDFIYEGLLDVVNNPANPNYNPEALSMTSPAGFRYGIVAMVVALGQVLLDQGYYSKAVAAANTKTLLKAYIVGTIIAWAPVPIISGNVFGGSALALGASTGKEIVVGTGVAPFIMQQVFAGGLGSIMYVLMVFMAGMTTGGGALAGAQAIFTIDIYKNYIKKDATEKEQTNFGRIMTIVIALIMAVVSMFFEGKSLLMVDIFSGIIFAAPCSALIAGLIWKKTSPKVALASIFIGMIGGIIAYFTIENQDINYFVGNVISLLLPLLIVLIGSLPSKYEFDFNILKNYRPSHEIHVDESNL